MNAGAAFVTADSLRAVLLFGLWPLWLLAGIADWACHRRSNIERTSGRPEWALHVLQAGQLGLGLAIMLFLQLNSLALLLLAALAFVHWLSALWDAHYTHPRREISPIEQSVHAVLELVPMFAVVLLALLHPESWQQPQWTLALKEQPLRPVAILAFSAVTLAALGGPLLEEGLRCARAGPLLRQSR